MTMAITVLVVVPQEEELQPLVEALSALGHTAHVRRVGRLDVVVFEELRLGVALGGHGKVQFAVQTQHLLDHLQEADTVVCAGAAGSLRDDLRCGDVVVGTCSVEHDYRLRFVPLPAPVHPGDLHAARAIEGMFADAPAGFSVRCGPIASGDEDVVDAARAQELSAQTGAVCVAWEGAGGARATAFSDRAFLELRVITDGADDNAASDYRMTLQTVMPNLAAVLAAWVQRSNNGIQQTAFGRS